MNKYGIGIAAIVIAALIVAVPLGLRFSQATLLFGFISLCCAPIVVHKIPETGWAIGLLVGLAIFASFPFRKLYQIDSVFFEALVVLAYVALLWLAGRGWQRKWR